jgi:hypothetical protein
VGPVFRAYDPDHDRLVAIKAFRIDLPPERAHQLVAEFERLIAAGLSHPAIVAPLATGIEGVTPYLAQEYVAAESLDVSLRHGTTLPSDAVRVAIDLAGALDIAATVDINHGVLHPRDVLLTADETRLTGLGIARALERVGVPTPVRRPYTAAERSVGSPWDHRADVYALAALVYEMLWSRRLAGGGDEAAAFWNEIPGGDLDSLRVIFARALAEDPAQRFDSALEFAGALTDAFTRPIAASPASALAYPLSTEPEPRLPLEPAVDEAVDPVADADLQSPAIGRMLLDDPLPDAEEIVHPVPAVAAQPMLLREPPAAPVEAFDSYRPAQPGPTGREGPRSAVSPLAFALLIGAALGFAAGVGVGARGRGAEATEVAASDAAAPPVSPAAGTTGGNRESAAGRIAGPAGVDERAPDPNALPTAAAPAPASGAGAPAAPAGSSAAASVAPAPAAPTTRNTAPARVETAAAGSLLVRSTPDGARVFVDNRDYGRTPVTVSALARGPHRVRITREGYVTDERQVTITAAQPAHSMTVRLVTARPPRPTEAATARAPARAAAGATLTGSGPLTVESRPVGAQVFLDGRLVGVTPLMLPDVAAGDHAVHLELEGYRRWSSAVRIMPSTGNRVAASLDR